jgi:large subunit ribosomal protein L30
MESVKSKGKIAVVRVRGLVNLRHDVKKTFEYLNLNNKNWCIVCDTNDVNKGMISKVKDYVTWGEVSEETISELVSKRGKETGEDKPNFEFKGKNYQKFFRLNSPKKGYGRKGVKLAFNLGGALGYRGDKINDLIRRMI